MLHFDTDDLRDVFVYTMIGDYLKTGNHCLSTGLSASGKPPKLIDAEIVFVFVITCLDHGRAWSITLSIMRGHGGHCSGDPTEVCDQSLARVSSPSSPPTAKKACVAALVGAMLHYSLDGWERNAGKRLYCWR